VVQWSGDFEVIGEVPNDDRTTSYTSFKGTGRTGFNGGVIPGTAFSAASGGAAFITLGDGAFRIDVALQEGCVGVVGGIYVMSKAPPVALFPRPRTRNLAAADPDCGDPLQLDGMAELGDNVAVLAQTADRDLELFIGAPGGSFTETELDRTFVRVAPRRSLDIPTPTT
jgi:hypothetical protein